MNEEALEASRELDAHMMKELTVKKKKKRSKSDSFTRGDDNRKTHRKASDPSNYPGVTSDAGAIAAAAAATSALSGGNPEQVQPVTCNIEIREEDMTDEEYHKMAAKCAFRRRSISEDTYDRLPVSYMRPYHEGASPECEPSSSGSSGIVCSKEDLKAMVFDHRRRRSPGPLRVAMRTLSLDAGRLRSALFDSAVSSRVSTESQLSESSRYSSISMQGDSIEEENCALMKCLETDIGSAAGSNLHIYPEVKLDSRSSSRVPSFSLASGECSRSSSRVPSFSLASTKDEPIRQTVPDIVYDENGQTWDVYGAEFDPEILGEAIQRHLMHLMQPKLEEQEEEVESTTPLQEVCQHGDKPDSSCSPSPSSSKKAVGVGVSYWLRMLCSFAGRRRSRSCQSSPEP